MNFLIPLTPILDRLWVIERFVSRYCENRAGSGENSSGLHGRTSFPSVHRQEEETPS